MTYVKPEVLASYTEAQLISEQNDLSAEGWGLWSNKQCTAARVILLALVTLAILPVDEICNIIY